MQFSLTYASIRSTGTVDKSKKTFKERTEISNSTIILLYESGRGSRRHRHYYVTLLYVKGG